MRETGGVYTPTVKTIIKKNTVQYKANTEAKQDKEVQETKKKRERK